MKEIDFLPQWYKKSKRRQSSYRRQYVEVTFLLIALTLWSFAGGKFLTNAQARLKTAENYLTVTKPFNAEFDRFQAELKTLQKDYAVLEKIDTKVNVSNIIAEIAFLVDDNIILESICIQSEKFEEQKTSTMASSVRLSNPAVNTQTDLPHEWSRYKVIISGIAADSTEATQLISRIEASPYFKRVIPGPMRNKEIKQIPLTEFEISCYLTNYVEK